MDEKKLKQNVGIYGNAKAKIACAINGLPIGGWLLAQLQIIRNE